MSCGSCRLKEWLRSVIAVAMLQPAAAAPIQPLAWELPCAAGTALKRPKKKKKKKKKKRKLSFNGKWNPEHVF